MAAIWGDDPSEIAMLEQSPEKPNNTLDPATAETIERDGSLAKPAIDQIEHHRPRSVDEPETLNA